MSDPEPWVEVKFPCGPCGATGKVRTDPPGVRFVAALHERRCTSCLGNGYGARDVKLSELRELLAQDPPAG